MRLAARGQKSQLPVEVYITLRRLGGVYVKFLQLLALRSESFQSLRSFSVYDVYDQVTTEPINIRGLLKSELQDQALELSLDSDIPFAAGSFGQVYEAQYQGRQVIIKVLRPTVAADLQFDLRVLGFLSRCIDWFSSSNAINTKQVYKEFARATSLETNYLLEADHAYTLYERYKSHPHIVIPYTYRELSTERLICQDYVGGIAVTDLIANKHKGVDACEYVKRMTGSDLKKQLVLFGSEMLSSVFLYGNTYGDPHPGNIKILPNNQIGLIDYGIQASAPRNTVQFRRLIEQYYKIYSGQPDIHEYARVLLDMCGGDVIQAVRSLDDFYGREHTLLDDLVENAERILERQSGRADYFLRNNKMIMLFNSLINENNRFCLQYDLDGPELMRAASLFVSLVMSLDVKNDVLREAFGIILERTGDIPLTGAQPTLHPETALEILAGWFDQISYKNPQLYRQIKSERASYV